jgi:23S rRNA (adenine2503-C2)-methyltransferase
MFDQVKALLDKKYRHDQLDQAIFRELVESVSEISVFGNALKTSLESAPLFALSSEKQLVSQDQKTVKIIFKTRDNYRIEAVLMRHQGRNTICVSSQIGCPCACTFCATGQLGLKRNLTAQEIVEQVLFFNRYLKQEYLSQSSPKSWNPKNPPPAFRVRNVVFMGMGEPLLNLAEVSKAIEVFNDDRKFGIGQRKITISTVGIIPGIKKLLAANLQVNLAVSLHQPQEAERSKIVPINKTYPLAELIPLLKKYSKNTGRRIFYEYTVIKGINDDPKSIAALGKLLRGSLCHLNFIPVNVHEGHNFQPQNQDSIRQIQKILLEKYGLVSTIRSSFGADIGGACGQLAGTS